MVSQQKVTIPYRYCGIHLWIDATIRYPEMEISINQITSEGTIFFDGFISMLERNHQKNLFEAWANYATL